MKGRLTFPDPAPLARDEPRATLAGAPSGQSAHLQQAPHVATEEIVLAGTPLFAGQIEPGGDIPGVDEVVLAVDHPGQPAPGAIEQQLVDA
ncbi:Uncharacterised protein [Mycobacteroides abscessus subsp. abscessus]|nr:Uncharacterised protein [Mycobacteroides abscessus subsp. abscessus]